MICDTFQEKCKFFEKINAIKLKMNKKKSYFAPFFKFMIQSKSKRIKKCKENNI